MGAERTTGLDDTAAAPSSTGTDATVAAAADGDTGSPVRLPEVSPKRYEIAGEVGRGGLGRVLRAHDRFLARTVALKELQGGGDDARRRFVREALITARLQHPSIVPVYDAGRWPDHAPFYAMKLVAGRPLIDLIDGAATRAARLALLPNVLAAADAVAYAHERRVIHRDLKPHNVLVGSHGETIVIDWGLAKDLAADERDERDAPAAPDGPDGAIDHTVAGALLGTPAYMAPEQAAGETVDERADVYALGALLYHVVAGRGPHRGATVAEVVARVVAGDVVPLHRLEPDAPRELCAIVGKAMARDRAARYPSARELADDLRRFTTDQLVGAHRYTLAQRLGRWIRRHRALLAATAGLIAFAAWSAWMVRRERASAIAAAHRELAMQAAGVQQDLAFSLDQADPILAHLRGIADPDLPFALIAPRLADLVVGRPGVSNVSVGFPSGTMRGTFVTLDGEVRVAESVIGANGTTRDAFRVDGIELEQVEETRSDYDVRQRPHYRLATAARARVWTPPRTYFTSHTTGITCTEPVYAPTGALAAVITVDFDVGALSQFIARAPLSGARTLVLAADGTVLAFPSARVPAVAARQGRLLRHEDFADPAVEALFRAVDLHHDVGALRFVELDADGTDYLAAIAPVGGHRAGVAAPLDWFVATVVPADTLLGAARARERQALIILAIGGGALIALGMALAGARRLRARRTRAQIRRTSSEPSE